MILQKVLNHTFIDARADARIAAASINDLFDVDTPHVADGEILVYDAGNSEFTTASIGSQIS